jgi:hypothetical protein
MNSKTFGKRVRRIDDGDHNWNNNKTFGIMISSQKRRLKKVNLNFDYADSKTAVVNISSDGKIHRAVLTDDEKNVIVYESQNLNYPRWGIYAVGLTEYLEIINEVSWIRNNLTEEEKEILDDLKKEAEAK